MGAEDKPRARAWVLLTVIVLGLGATALAIAAEPRRTKTYKFQTDVNGALYCVYPSSDASSLAYCALALLVIAQLVANLAAGCPCFKRTPLKPGLARKCAVATAILSWIFYAAAAATLVSAAVENNYHTRSARGTAVGGARSKCTLVSSGMFAAGAACSLLSVVFVEMYYICIKRAAFEQWRQGSDESDGQALAVDMEELPMKLG